MSPFKEVCHKRNQKNRMVAGSKMHLTDGYFLQRCLPVCLDNNKNEYTKEKMDVGKVRIPGVIFLSRQKGMGSRWLKAHFVHLHQQKEGRIYRYRGRQVSSC